MPEFRPDRPETVFTYGAPELVFGAGARHEIGHHLIGLGVTRVLLVTDPGVAAAGGPDEVATALRADRIDVTVFDRTRVEPTDASLREAAAFAAAGGPFDAIVAVGGGSAIDTAKAVNLLITNDGDLMDYVNAPVGRGLAPIAPLLPLVAVPTTTGTGSESTTICVLDIVDLHVKTGISHARLRPTRAVVDPELTMTQPRGVTASSGLDVLCHALESYTARPHTSYERRAVSERVPYCGSNPISDVWSERALSLMATSFGAVVADGDDRGARADVALAATFAGLGFGNAGVHIPHANAYPIASRVRDFRPDGYDDDHPMIPHGMAVALTAPAAFRFTYSAAPERHVRAAALLAPGATCPDDPADFLPQVLTAIMREVGLPAGLETVGFDLGDVGHLVDGARRQQRLLSMAPREVGADDLAAILTESMRLW